MDKSVDVVDVFEGTGVKTFFDRTDEPIDRVCRPVTESTDAPSSTQPGGPATKPVSARIAIYDSLASSPRVEDVDCVGEASAIETIAAVVYHSAREMGGGLPFMVIREVVENLVHAEFRDVVVSVLDSGETIRFADRGPGIIDKQRVFLPGFSTATATQRRVIKGVGSGLPIVRECMMFSGGVVTLEDNLGAGTVVTLSVPTRSAVEPAPPKVLSEERPVAACAPAPRLSTRQKRVLSLVMELNDVGPTQVAQELAVSVSTAHRDLAFLEEAELISSDPCGKRSLTDNGISYLDSLFK